MIMTMLTSAPLDRRFFSRTTHPPDRTVWLDRSTPWEDDEDDDAGYDAGYDDDSDDYDYDYDDDEDDNNENNYDDDDEPLAPRIKG